VSLIYPYFYLRRSESVDLIAALRIGGTSYVPQLIKMIIIDSPDDIHRVLGKWEKAPETDSFIALHGTIYSTSMYSRTDAHNTRGDILDAANEGWCFKSAAIAGRIMIMLMRGDTINGAHARV
jgi:hypothetical protein